VKLIFIAVCSVHGHFPTAVASHMGKQEIQPCNRKLSLICDRIFPTSLCNYLITVGLKTKHLRLL
jgi:hypothetical protein